MKRDIILWAVVLAGPVIWFLSFGANFALAPWACAWNSKPMLFAISAVALLLTAGTGAIAWGQWQQVGREFPGEAAGPQPRWRVLAIGGVTLSALSCLLIIAQGIAEIVLGACQ